MEPFGPLNTRPVFLARNLVDTGYSKILKEKHLRISLKDDQSVMTGIGFGMADKYHLLQDKKPVDVVFKIDENEWNGEKNLQVRLLDIRLTS